MREKGRERRRDNKVGREREKEKRNRQGMARLFQTFACTIKIMDFHIP